MRKNNLKKVIKIVLDITEEYRRICYHILIMEKYLSAIRKEDKIKKR
jgi:hypothetical protein